MLCVENYSQHLFLSLPFTYPANTTMAFGDKTIEILGLAEKVVPIVVPIPLFDISSIGGIAQWLKTAISSVLYGPEPSTPDYVAINAIEELRALEEGRMCANVIGEWLYQPTRLVDGS